VTNDESSELLADHGFADLILTILGVRCIRGNALK